MTKRTDCQSFTTIDTPKDERQKLHVGDIWANQAKCNSCGELIRSKNKHDYVTCKCGQVSVDGGSWYLKRAITKGGSFEEKSIFYTDVDEDE